MPDSGTKDKNYDLVSVLRDCLHHAWTLEEYANDAEKDGDSEAADLFRRMQQHSVKGAEEAKKILASRLAS